jgi:hypothetical protein
MADTDVETDDPLHVATFQADVTPSIGAPVTYGTVEAIDDPLSCRGVVLLAGGLPIVLAAVDWIGNANGGHDAWRFALADAAGTAPERVAVHAVHQHEAPMFDADAEALLLAHGVEGEGIDAAFAREAIRRSAASLREAAADPERVTHAGVGTATVERVASNRQLLGADGTCVHFRASSEPDARWREAPEGLVDPRLRMLSFWNGEEPLAALSYYATHPQSYYRNGRVTCDVPGIARDRHEASADVFRVHFTGAAGNVAAGKYNDGSEERRPVLADRVAGAMDDAWVATERTPVAAGDVGWSVERVALPPAERFERADLPMERSALVGALADEPDRDAARALAWLRRCEAGHRIDLPRLRVGDARVLHLPGEPFVEYQLAAARWRPDLTVATAGYGDYGPGYVGTRAAYPKGGYEVPGSSLVAPDVEEVLTEAMRSLLDAGNATLVPSDVTAEKPRLDR